MATDQDLIIETPEPIRPPVKVARDLLWSSDAAMLATCAGRAPHAALVTPVCTHDLHLVLLLSNLSRHTTQLRTNPRCAVLLVSNAPELSGTSNPQTLPRLSVLCHAQPDDDPALRRRYLSRRPYARMYADFADFRIWRLEIQQAQLVEGFAKAWELGAKDLAYPEATKEAFRTDEPGILRHSNADRANAIAELGRCLNPAEPGWSMIGVDPDGCDLMCGDRWARVRWPATLGRSTDVQQALGTAVACAREMLELKNANAGAVRGASVSSPQAPAGV